jgi:chromosome segregation ATPase
MDWPKRPDRPGWERFFTDALQEAEDRIRADIKVIADRQNSTHDLLERIMSQQSTEQGEIEQDASTITGLLTDLNTQSGNLNTAVQNAQSELTTLEQEVAAGNAPDLTDLRNALSGVQTARQAIDSAVSGAGNLAPQPAPSNPPAPPASS